MQDSDLFMLLTESELKTLTGRERLSAQIKALIALGINYKINAAGKLLVVRQHATQVLSGDLPTRSKRKTQPAFENAR